MEAATGAESLDVGVATGGVTVEGPSGSGEHVGWVLLTGDCESARDSGCITGKENSVHKNTVNTLDWR